jgi:plastocyanin
MRMARGVTPAFVASALFVLVSCSSGTPKAGAPPSSSMVMPTTFSAPVAAQASTPSASASASVAVAPPASKAHLATYVIHIRNFAYVPAAPVVAVGQPIEIINDDDAAHTWSAAPKSNWTYTSGNLEKGQHVIFVGFTAPGRYPFLCYYHAEMPSMNGVITVNPA